MFIIFAFAIILFGIGRYELKLFKTESQVSNLIGQSISLRTYVSAEPDVRQDGVRYIVNVQDKNITGKLYLKLGLYPRYNYGDQLQVSCELVKPEELDNGFRYDMYLGVMNVWALCKNPQVVKIGEGSGSEILKIIYAGKKVVAEKIQALWPEPSASLVAGLLYGYRGGVGELTDNFNRVGLTHIIAISGYNISVIVAVFSTLLIYLLIPRKKAVSIVIGGLLLFIIFVGFSGSVVRAGVMGFLVLLAKQWGRISKIDNALVFTVVVLCLANPLILFWDAGFQLSFAATLGLVYLSPLIEKLFNKIVMLNLFQHLSHTKKILKQVQDDKIINFIRESFISTLSAIIATLPLILFHFERFSVVAPLVNVLVLWIIPFIMLISFGALVLSFVYWPIASFVAWLAYLGLKYVIIITTWFASFKFAAVEIGISWWLMILMYVSIIYIVCKQSRQSKQNK